MFQKSTSINISILLGLLALGPLRCDDVNTLIHPAPLDTYQTPGNTVALAVLNRNTLAFEEYYIAADLIGLAEAPETAGGLDLDGDGTIDLEYTAQPETRDQRLASRSNVVYKKVELDVTGVNFPDSVSDMILVADERYVVLEQAGGSTSVDFLLDDAQLLGLWRLDTEEEVSLDTPLDIPVSRIFRDIDDFKKRLRLKCGAFIVTSRFLFYKQATVKASKMIN